MVVRSRTPFMKGWRSIACRSRGACSHEMQFMHQVQLLVPAQPKQLISDLSCYRGRCDLSDYTATALSHI